jgi:glucosamine-6-phosphate deaminase
VLATRAHPLEPAWELDATLSRLWFRRSSNRLRVCPGEGLAEVVADEFVRLLRSLLARKPRAVISVSAGRTFRPVYALLRGPAGAQVEWSRVSCIQMDEYAGLGCQDPRSLAAELQREFVAPNGVGEFLRFYDRSGRLRHPLENVERGILALGGIDVALHGVGRNGHIGFNEPGSLPGSATRLVRLTQSTRAANGVQFRTGITLGLRVLRRARVSMIALRGMEKRRCAAALLFGSASAEQPVTYLRDGAMVSVFMDHEAAPAPLVSRPLA